MEATYRTPLAARALPRTVAIMLRYLVNDGLRAPGRGAQA